MRTKQPTIMAVAPDDTTYRLRCKPALAWHAARGIAMGSQYCVVLLGQYGIASFYSDGSGSGEVMWNSSSTTPGETSRFGPRDVACIC